MKLEEISNSTMPKSLNNLKCKEQLLTLLSSLFKSDTWKRTIDPSIETWLAGDKHFSGGLICRNISQKSYQDLLIIQDHWLDTVGDEKLFCAVSATTRFLVLYSIEAITNKLRNK